MCDVEDVGNSHFGYGNPLTATSKYGARDSYICTRMESSNSPMPEDQMAGKECTMCGDVGITNYMFQCKICHHRYQHLYCSRSYPNLGSEKWVCNWCMNANTNDHSQKQQRANLPNSKSNAFDFLLKVPESSRDAGKVVVGRQTRCSKESIIRCGNIPKRLRCHDVGKKSKAVALEKSRQIVKSRFQLNPQRGIVRRYKFLADVL
eukprot:c22053_g1_i1 orf=184-798(-)